MVIIAYTINVIIFVLLRTLYLDRQYAQSSSDASNDANLTLASLMSNSIHEKWIFDPSIAAISSQDSTAILINELPMKNFSAKICKNGCRDTVLSDFQYDNLPMTSSLSAHNYVESIFEPPQKEVDGNWKVVSGTYKHYDDENWKEFLTKADVPLLVRLIIENMSETMTITRKFSSPRRKDVNGKDWFEVLVDTSIWFINYEIIFRLGENTIEHDIDGTDSENLFFFANPRLLVQNKLKDNRRVSIIRHFDEKGFNATLIDRDRLVIARRLYERV